MIGKQWSGFVGMILATVVACTTVAQPQAPQGTAGKPGVVEIDMVVV